MSKFRFHNERREFFHKIEGYEGNKFFFVSHMVGYPGRAKNQRVKDFSGANGVYFFTIMNSQKTSTTVRHLQNWYVT